ncbi:MAG TPA: DUF1015 domain-containing protein [Deltaproteobacteria bacterium]|nr:MAG: hypothetical protein A2Z79_07030 [Deltaproteobacteria bacterium GWA2_55_82]OGQ63242.1 MAG: hypothetical protein A3I81_00570 [Deltaproteobacteria bacterium RIFCSPLOWO2_02_FULL_55_12]OIJ73077.1 MAG: hypothetical protein A2V21_301635 [Deltaproteobacteria bacterium GWC2_55_46]HBG47838.1 DUF1015 domain-containing protein [Deltaproteobacteria bacterium]HCY11899.1 DUF1015 domain-containing protein [Deltaproteobacteria bacterium]
MAEIIPFRGVLYDPAKVGDLTRVMAPPYDVIPPKKQDALYERHPNNIIRLILGKTAPEDRDGNDRYSRAATDFQKWLGEGVLAQDERPAIYYYYQAYTEKDGSTQTRKGFIALSKLQDFGKGIHPHERTLSGPKADRLKLMQACDANFSSIFSLYSDPALTVNKALDAAIAGREPDIDVLDDDGIVNKVWRVDDPKVLSAVAASMDDKALFIADGHHRYETALNYRNMQREKKPDYTGSEPFNYVMMYFSNMDDEGMTIWPTHRVVHSLKGFDADGFVAKCAEHFDISEFPYKSTDEPKVREQFLKELEASGAKDVALGLHIRARDKYYLLSIKSHDMDKVFGGSIPDVFKSLDVTVLHSLVFARILGMTQEAQEKQENLIYVKSFDEAIAACSNDNNQLVFLLNSTKIEQVKAVALAGFVMPQKSTYFYPKLLSGLTINFHGIKALKTCCCH